MEDEKYLLEKILFMNERLRQLKLQGESSNNKTLKNLRVRRNKCVEDLLKLLKPETSFYDENKLMRSVN